MANKEQTTKSNSFSAFGINAHALQEAQANLDFSTVWFLRHWTEKFRNKELVSCFSSSNFDATGALAQFFYMAEIALIKRPFSRKQITRKHQIIRELRNKTFQSEIFWNSSNNAAHKQTNTNTCSSFEVFSWMNIWCVAKKIPEAYSNKDSPALTQTVQVESSFVLNSTSRFLFIYLFFYFYKRLYCMKTGKKGDGAYYKAQK